MFEIDFEDPPDLEKVRPDSRSKQLDLARDESFAHSGRASMRLGVTDPGGAQHINPSIEIELSWAIPASEIMAISCWVYVPAELADHFFGRYDARIFVNGRSKVVQASHRARLEPFAQGIQQPLRASPDTLDPPAIWPHFAGFRTGGNPCL